MQNKLISVTILLSTLLILGDSLTPLRFGSDVITNDIEIVYRHTNTVYYLVVNSQFEHLS